jgi:hypothetical protein
MARKHRLWLYAGIRVGCLLMCQNWDLMMTWWCWCDRWQVLFQGWTQQSSYNETEDHPATEDNKFIRKTKFPSKVLLWQALHKIGFIRNFICTISLDYAVNGGLESSSIWKMCLEWLRCFWKINLLVVLKCANLCLLSSICFLGGNVTWQSIETQPFTRKNNRLGGSKAHSLLGYIT